MVVVVGTTVVSVVVGEGDEVDVAAGGEEVVFASSPGVLLHATNSTATKTRRDRIRATVIGFGRYALVISPHAKFGRSQSLRTKFGCRSSNTVHQQPFFVWGVRQRPNFGGSS